MWPKGGERPVCGSSHNKSLAGWEEADDWCAEKDIMQFSAAPKSYAIVMSTWNAF